MTLAELQYPETGGFDEWIAKNEADYKDGRMREEDYHAGLLIYHSLNKDVEATRRYASQFLPGASPRIVAEANMALARIAAFEKDVPAAIAHYRQVLAVDPEHDAAWEEIGHCLVDQGEYAEAITYLDKALVELDDWEDLWISKGKALGFLKQHSEALTCFTKARECSDYPSTKALCNYFIGVCHQEMGDSYRALAHYTYALQDDPSLGEAINNMANVYSNAEDDDLVDIDKAIEHLLKAEDVAKERDNKELLLMVCRNLSSLYRLTGNMEQHKLYKNKIFRLMGVTEEGITAIDMLSDFGEYLADEDDMDDDTDDNGR